MNIQPPMLECMDLCYEDRYVAFPQNMEVWSHIHLLEELATKALASRILAFEKKDGR